MKRIIQAIFPPSPPFPAMKFTRQPVLHLFWGGGLVGLAVGFLVGFLLWLWQMGLLEIPENYLLLKHLHARVQILGFLGSFLLGFALQAGPNVVGGIPPSSKLLIKFMPLLWSGIPLTLLPFPMAALLGNLLISLAFAGPAFLLLRVTLAGNAQLRITRGLPLAAVFALLAIAPWLNLEEPQVALFILWCGPVTAAMVAAQQLISNVMKGAVLQGGKGWVFVFTLGLAWFLTGMAAFWESGYWSPAGLAWFSTLLILVWGTGFAPIALGFGFVAINVTLILAMAGAMSAAIMMMIGAENIQLDAVVHLLGAGVLTLLVIGVASRVAGFFSGFAVLADRTVVYILLLWTLVAAARVATSMAWLPMTWVPWAVFLGGVLLIVWGASLAKRLGQISK